MMAMRMGVMRCMFLFLCDAGAPTLTFRADAP